ncbi:MAG: condensation domain-containing protein, partial [Cyclobacteriaceae bacterium]
MRPATEEKIFGLLSKAYQSGIRIVLDGEKLKIKAINNVTPDAELVDKIRACKPELITYLAKQKRNHSTDRINKGASTFTIQPYNKNDKSPLPLSYSQERLWFIHQLEGSVQYHQPIVLKLQHPDHEIIEQSLQYLIDRHEILRTVYYEDKGQPFQKPLPAGQWKLDILSAPNWDKNQLHHQVETYLGRPFDLEKDHMLRAMLVNGPDGEALLAIIIHHIANDGWSTPILLREFKAAYEAISKKSTPDLPALPLQYADYALWQKEQLSSKKLAPKIEFWKELLQETADLNLSFDSQKSVSEDQTGNEYTVNLTDSLAEKLRTFSRENGYSLFMPLLSVFDILLYNQTGQQRFCVGTPVANRNRSEWEGLIGFFVNTLPIPCRFNPQQTFINYLSEKKTVLLDAFANEDVPFEKIVEALEVERIADRSPLFQVMFSYQRVEEEEARGPLENSQYFDGITRKHSLYPLSLDCIDSPSGIKLTFNYRSDLFQQDSVRRMAIRYQQLLSQFLEMPEMIIESASILPQEEANLIRTFGKPSESFVTNETIVSLFDQAAEAYASHTAVAMPGQPDLSYERLSYMADQVAG